MAPPRVEPGRTKRGFEDMARRVPDTSLAPELAGFHPELRLREIIRL